MPDDVQSRSRWIPERFEQLALLAANHERRVGKMADALARRIKEFDDDLAALVGQEVIITGEPSKTLDHERVVFVPTGEPLDLATVTVYSVKLRGGHLGRCADMWVIQGEFRHGLCLNNISVIFPVKTIMPASS